MTTETPLLQVQNLSLRFPAENGELAVLKNLSFSIEHNEFLCILGPSGCGKSSLLKVLAGLLRPTSGEVHLACGAGSPKVGLVFQQANLMPWRTVMENIILPLELQGIGMDEARQQAHIWVETMGLAGFETAIPRDLSGGMAQRVAIARALIQDPDLLLLDEPFGALDALTRERMGTELLDLWQERRPTVIMVTHSISEALLLADRVLVLTPRPAEICLDLINPLPRPRGEAVRYTPEFGEQARILRAAIREQ